MRKAALRVVLRPGASELELAGAMKELATNVVPLLGPMIEDLLHLELRRSFETEAGIAMSLARTDVALETPDVALETPDVALSSVDLRRLLDVRE